MDDPNIPPRIYPGPPSTPPPRRPQNAFQRLVGAIGTGLLAIWKFVLPLAKLGPFAKILPTMLSMLLSMGIYATLFGLPFAAGFLICILIHELGHVFAAWRLGRPVSAPMFIPFMGAVITLKSQSRSAFEDALVGIGGPIAGCFSAIACWAIFLSTGQAIFLGLAYVAFFLNLFNMMPMYPLDGGRIVGAINPFLWLFGVVAMVVMFLTGTIRNPMILILLVLSVPRMIQGIRSRDVDLGYAVKTTAEQKWLMGVAYVGLSLTLFWGMGVTHDQTINLRQFRERQSQSQRVDETPFDDSDTVRN